MRIGTYSGTVLRYQVSRDKSDESIKEHVKGLLDIIKDYNSCNLFGDICSLILNIAKKSPSAAKSVAEAVVEWMTDYSPLDEETSDEEGVSLMNKRYAFLMMILKELVSGADRRTYFPPSKDPGGKIFAGTKAVVIKGLRHLVDYACCIATIQMADELLQKIDHRYMPIDNIQDYKDNYK